MSPPRVIRPAARRSPAGARSLLWTAAAAALPVIVTVLVLAAITLGALVFTGRGFDALFAVVAVEWLVVNRIPLTVDDVSLGFLPLLPPLVYVAVLGRQTRAVLSDVEQPGAREAGAAVAGVTLAGLLLTALASLLVGSAASDFAVREASPPTALLWTAVVGLVGSGAGVWMYFRRDLREVLPLWVRGGIHLGVAFVSATWAIATLLVLTGIVFAWGPVGGVLEIGKTVAGTAALTGISVGYLPNVVMAGAALLVGGEAHLGQASYSVFAVSRGPMPEVPLAAVLPNTTPHWAVQALLLVTVLVVAGLARSVAHWFRTTADAVRATWLGAAIVALAMALTPVVAGGELGALGTVGTGSLIAAASAFALFGVIGSATIALSLAGLTRRRERAESELRRRRNRAGVVTDPAGATEPDPLADHDPVADPTQFGEPDPVADPGSFGESDPVADPDRDSAFDPDRDSAFDPDRDSAFDPDRDSAFDPDLAADPDIEHAPDLEHDPTGDPDPGVGPWETPGADRAGSGASGGEDDDDDDEDGPEPRGPEPVADPDDAGRAGDEPETGPDVPRESAAPGDEAATAPGDEAATAPGDEQSLEPDDDRP